MTRLHLLHTYTFTVFEDPEAPAWKRFSMNHDGKRYEGASAMEAISWCVLAAAAAQRKAAADTAERARLAGRPEKPVVLGRHVVCVSRGGIARDEILSGQTRTEWRTTDERGVVSRFKKASGDSVGGPMGQMARNDVVFLLDMQRLGRIVESA